MPSNKTLVVAILCASIIISVVIFNRKPNLSLAQKSVEKVQENSVVDVYNKIVENTDASWKKVLTNVDTSKQKTADLTKNNDGGIDEATITAQISKDLLYQYMIAKAGGKEVTKEDLDKIATTIYANPQYSRNTAPQYKRVNIKIVPDSTDSLSKYKKEVNLILKNRSTEVKENPIKIFGSFITQSNPAELKKLDPLIATAKKTIAQFLEINVPNRAAVVHVYILNSVSQILTDMESMREAEIDPYKSMLYLKDYDSHMKGFYDTLDSLNSLLDSIKG